MYNQRNYRPFGQRLPAPTPQAGLPPYRPTGTLNSNQPYLRPPPPPPPPLQNPNWSQNQHPTPRIAPPYPHFYRLPPPPLAPLPASSYFSPAPFGSFLPPPPSSPPRPPPLPPASPPTTSNVNQSQTTVKNTSEFNILSDIPPPPPRDEKTVKKIQVLCQYIAKNGDKFEHMTCQKEIGNPEFEFLFGGVPGSQAAISHEYFKWMKKKYISNELPEQEHNRDISHSPAGSDMDMEDDITHPEEPGKSFVSANHEVDIKPKEGLTLAPDDNQFEKPTTTVGVVDSERSVDSKTEQCNIDLHQQMNQSKESPFRLVQGYASDDSSENDNEPHFENVSPVNEPFFENLSPVAVSPEVKNGTTLSEPVVEASLNITSNIPEPSTNTQSLDNKNDGGTSIEGNNTDCRKNGGARKENSNAKLQVDEFGRMVKKGGDESDSDDYNRRRSKRGRRSRSRSRSPYERRRRSPRRRRENRSRSRSWSPKKRPRSRSPYNRRNRSQLQEICHDFRLGRCFRETCRYSHDPEKIDESWRRRNKQQYLEPVSDRFQNSDKLVPEKYEADKHVNCNDSVNKEFVESPGHTSDVASEQPTTGTAISGGEPQLAGEYNVPLLPSSSWNSLPPPPPLPRPQLGGPIPHYQQNQPSFQNNFSFQPFVTPYGPQMTSHLGVYPMNYPIIQQPVGPTSLGQDNIAQNASSLNLVSSNFRPVGPASFSQDNFAQISSSPNLVASNAREPPSGITQYFLQNLAADSTAEFPRSRISSHYNPYASTFDKPLSNTFGPSPDQKDTSGGDQYDPLFDSIDPSSLKKSDNGTKEVAVAVAVTASEENDEFGETADAEVGAVENDSHSPSSPIDLRDVGTREIEIDQVKPKKSKDSRSMKLFKVSVADFVKEVLKPSWRQGNMSKEAFKTIVKKTVDKVSGAMKKHQVPKSQAKINHYIDSSQRKLTKLVMGYVDKYVKV